jgi:release factor glutamine methyltransferase
MSIRLLKYLTPVLQPVYRKYLSKTRPFSFKNIRVLVRPGVFFPGFIFSTRLFLQFIEQLDLKGKTFLELGAGSGIISLFAASRGAVVTASDINPLAVQNIGENATMNKIKLTIIESDLFERISQSTFDFIIISPPYYPKDPANCSEMAWFCGKNFEYFERLFQQLPGFYDHSSQVLMILSEDCNILRIKEIAASNGFEFSLLFQKMKFGEWNYIFRLYRNEQIKSNFYNNPDNILEFSQ